MTKQAAKYIKESKLCKLCSRKFVPKVHNQYYCKKECQLEMGVINYRKQNSSFLKLRFDVFRRDKFSCVYCGRNVKEDKIKLQCDHVLPKSKGGLGTMDNLVTSCHECNLGKSDNHIS